MAGGRRHRRAVNGDTFLESVKLRLTSMEKLVSDLHWQAVGQHFQGLEPATHVDPCIYGNYWMSWGDACGIYADYGSTDDCRAFGGDVRHGDEATWGNCETIAAEEPNTSADEIPTSAVAAMESNQRPVKKTRAQRRKIGRASEDEGWAEKLPSVASEDTPHDESEIGYRVRWSRGRAWGQAWHGWPSPSEASTSERSWRRISALLCCRALEGYDEMRRACDYCGAWEHDEDCLVACQGPDCSLRKADGLGGGVFHGRCATALGHLGGEPWCGCPWCPRKPNEILDVGDGREENPRRSDDLEQEEGRDFDGEAATGCSDDPDSSSLEGSEMITARPRSAIPRHVREQLDNLAANLEATLQAKLQERRRRLVQALPVHASPAERTQTLLEIQACLKDAEESLRADLDEEYAELEAQFMANFR